MPLAKINLHDTAAALVMGPGSASDGGSCNVLSAPLLMAFYLPPFLPYLLQDVWTADKYTRVSKDIYSNRVCVQNELQRPTAI